MTDNKKELIEQVKKEATEIARKEIGLPKDEARRGLCHIIWRHQKRILKEKHNIDWKSPAEENPHIIFD
ncbi:MAG: hypothetical protein V1692_00615 [bacterium]